MESLPLIRKAFVFQLHPGKGPEYQRRHNPIWPELGAILRSHGVRSYSIFLHPDTLQLFAYAEIESEERWSAIAETPECQRWWASMRELMVTHPDDRPMSVNLDCVFDLCPSIDGR